MWKKSASVIAVLAAATLAAPGIGTAQTDYPNKPINFIVPYGPGGTVDPVARIFSAPVSRALGQPVVVLNKPGAAGSIGTEFATQSAPDGYTVLIHTNLVTSEACLKSNLPYKFVEQMTPITTLTETPFVILINPSVKANNVKELVGLLKANPGKVRYGSAGLGSSGHLRGEQFLISTGTKMTFIPFKDGGSTLIGLVRDDINVAFDTLPGSMPLIADGKMKALSVSTDKRWPAAPNVPTITEQGFPPMASQWIGAFVPAKTPQPVIKKLHDAFAQALASPEIKEQLSKIALAAVTGLGPEKTAQIVKDETKSWCDTIKAAGIKLEN